RDRVLVVLHEEDHRGAEDAGEVERLVEVPFARGTVPAQGQDHRVLTLEPGGVTDADGVQQLGGQRRGLRGDVVRQRVVGAVPVPGEVGEHVDRVDPAADDGEAVPVGGYEPVTGAQGRGGGDLAGLLAVRG